MAFSTIYDLLLEARKGDPLGVGSCTTVNVIPAAGFENYVLKCKDGNTYIPKFDIPHFLKRTTSLIPVDYGLQYNFGQPRLLVDGAIEPFEILRRAPGEAPFKQYEQDVDRFRDEGMTWDEAKNSSNANVIRRVAALPDNYFEEWMNRKRVQIKKGIGGNNNYGNIMLDEANSTLRDVDVLGSTSTTWKLNNAEDILKAFEPPQPSHAEPIPELHQVREKIFKAAHSAGLPETEKWFMGRKQPKFAAIDRTAKLGHFKLSDAPEKLLELLKDMEHRYPIR